MDARAQASERVGALIADKYRLRRVLGVGGMGAVYEAVHEYTERRVAVKLLHPAFLDASSVTAKRFMLEAKAAAAIQHPSVVEVLDAGEDRGVPYLVFELLAGETLSMALLEGHLNQGDLVEVATQVLEVLELAHARGIVHRDIKPENVFLGRGEAGTLRAKVLDFGIARRLDAPLTGDPLTQRGAVLGTPYYMSPEQMTGGAVDGRADVWAVGAVLYRGLSGRVPFEARDYAALLAEVLQRGAAPLATHRPDLPEGLLHVVDRALEREVARRWTSAAEMRVALAPFLRSRPSMVPAPIAALAAAGLTATTPVRGEGAVDRTPPMRPRGPGGEGAAGHGPRGPGGEGVAWHGPRRLGGEGGADREPRVLRGEGAAALGDQRNIGTDGVLGRARGEEGAPAGRAPVERGATPTARADAVPLPERVIAAADVPEVRAPRAAVPPPARGSPAGYEAGADGPRWSRGREVVGPEIGPEVVAPAVIGRVVAAPAAPASAAPASAAPASAAPASAAPASAARASAAPPLPRSAPAHERPPAAWERALGEIEREIEALRAQQESAPAARPSDAPAPDGGAWIKKLFGPKRGRS